MVCAGKHEGKKVSSKGGKQSSACALWKGLACFLPPMFTLLKGKRDVPYMGQLDGLSALVKKHAAHWRSVEPSSAMIVDERQFGRQDTKEGGQAQIANVARKKEGARRSG